MESPPPPDLAALSAAGVKITFPALPGATPLSQSDSVTDSEPQEKASAAGAAGGTAAASAVIDTPGGTKNEHGTAAADGVTVPERALSEVLDETMQELNAMTSPPPPARSPLLSQDSSGNLEKFMQIREEMHQDEVMVLIFSTTPVSLRAVTPSHYLAHTSHSFVLFLQGADLTGGASKVSDNATVCAGARCDCLRLFSLTLAYSMVGRCVSRFLPRTRCSSACLSHRLLDLKLWYADKRIATASASSCS